jgi:hypothetical protein
MKPPTCCKKVANAFLLFSQETQTERWELLEFENKFSIIFKIGRLEDFEP